MNKKIVLSSILSIVLCISIITGATFALFTSESTTNIAITSGKVDVKAELSVAELYSPTMMDANGVATDATDAATDSFKNGGTVAVNGGEIEISKMTPGDKAIFKIDIINNSNVEFVQRITLGCADSDKAFFNKLLIGICDTEDGEYTYYSDFATAWTQGVAVDEETISSMFLAIELPGYVGNDAEEKSCKLNLAVNAIQGNVEVTETAVDNRIYVVETDEELATAIAEFKDGETIVLYGSEWTDKTTTIAYEDTRTLNVRGVALDTLTVNAPEAAVHVYNNVRNVNCQFVAMESLYIYGNVAGTLNINSGRAVVKNGASVKEITIYANKTDKDVKLLVENGTATVGSIAVKSVSGTNKVTVELPKNDNVPEKVSVASSAASKTDVVSYDKRITNMSEMYGLYKAQDGETYALCDDILNDKSMSSYVVNIKKSVTINFVNYIYTLKGKTVQANRNAVNVTAGNVVFEANNGGIVVDMPVTSKGTNMAARVSGGTLTVNGGVYESKTGYCMGTLGSGTLTINDGKFIGATTVIQAEGNGSVVINGGFFQCSTEDSSFLINQIDSSRETSSIVINGGTFVNFDPSNNTAEGAGTNFVAEGYVVTSAEQENGDVWYTVSKAPVAAE